MMQVIRTEGAEGTERIESKKQIIKTAKIKIMKLIAPILLLIFLGAGAHSIANTDQTFRVSNNDTILAAFSKNEITRISFQDEIISVNSLKGELEYEIQGRDLYLRVTVEKPINFFIKIQNGNIYKFIATAEEIPATQIFVKPKVIVKSKISKCKTGKQQTK